MEFRPYFSSVFLAFLLSASGCALEDCVWDKDFDFPKNPPIILDDSFHMILPVLQHGSRIVRVPAGDTVILACSGNELVNLDMAAVEARCVQGGKLEIGDSRWELAKLGCSDDVEETIHRDLGTCGDGSIGVLHSIGFEILNPMSFYELIRVCFDPVAETTLYTEHVLHGANIAAKDIDSSRPSFKSSSGFFSVSMSTVYSKNSQLELMTHLLGDADLANTIIDDSKQLYFAKGHMSPDADFVTEAEQDATYYYINALPQWQAFNNGNWKYLEYATRDLAEKLGNDLMIYSGGWGVLELDDINGNPAEVFLGLTEDQKVVPAPALTWKVVHDKGSNRAAAIVGVNNPHLTAVPTPLCTDLCSSLSWIDFDTSDLAHGYTYCCSVEDLRAAVPHVPDLGHVGLLTG